VETGKDSEELSKPFSLAVNRYCSIESLKVIDAPPKVVIIIGMPCLPALIALAGGPPTARQIGNVSSIGRGKIFMLFKSGLNFPEDRKSTRLNSSHVSISYAVFCLKKKRSNASRM